MATPVPDAPPPLASFEMGPDGDDFLFVYDRSDAKFWMQSDFWVDCAEYR